MRLEEFLADHTDVKEVKAGGDIFAKSERATAAYFIIEGAVEVYEPVDDGHSTMARLGPGEIFGEMALLRFDKYTLSAKAVEDTRLYVIPPEMLHEEIKSTHPLVKAILDMLLDRIHNVNEVLIDMDKVNRA